MLRACGRRLAAAPSAQQEIQRQRMSVLYKIVCGDTPLKNKAPVKDCNIEAIFGKTWRNELTEWFSKDYTAGMEAGDKKAAQERLDKYMRRLNLTRYTAAELAAFMAGGAHSVDDYAKASQIADAKAFAAAHGEAALKSHVEAEAKNANWDASMTAKFLADVKAA